MDLTTTAPIALAVAYPGLTMDMVNAMMSRNMIEAACINSAHYAHKSQAAWRARAERNPKVAEWAARSIAAATENADLAHRRIAIMREGGTWW